MTHCTVSIVLFWFPWSPNKHNGHSDCLRLRVYVDTHDKDQVSNTFQNHSSQSSAAKIKYLK